MRQPMLSALDNDQRAVYNTDHRSGHGRWRSKKWVRKK